MSSRRTRRAFVATAAAGGASWLLATHTTALLAQRRAATPVSGYRVVNAYPHDPDAYTQGLIYRGGFLYESTGRNGQSTLRKVKLETGAVVQQRRVDQEHFAEGLTEWKGRLYQLTWQSNVAFVYDLATFAPVRTSAVSRRRLGSDRGARGPDPQRRQRRPARPRSRRRSARSGA